MLNNTSSLPKLSGQLARGDESSITAKSVDKSAESFGSVLARQMSGHTDKTADNAKPADSGTTTATDEKDPQAAPAIPADQVANPLAILLLAKQESKSAPEAGGKAVVADELSAAAVADPDNRKPVGSEFKDGVTEGGELKDCATGGSELNIVTTAAVPAGMLTVPPELAGKTTTAGEINSNTIAASLVHKAAAEPGDKSTSSVKKPAIGTPALSANSTEPPARATATRTGAARDNAPVPSAVTSADVTAKPGLRSEPLKATELTSALPVQPPQAQAGTTPGLQPGATTPASGNTFTAPLGHSAWPAEFSQKVSWISTQKNQVAELHLNPPELGPINIVLKISDNQATAQFTSPHSAVRDAIENAIPKLRESLADNGIMLGQATVSDQTPRDNSAHHMNQRAHSRRMADDAPADAAMASLPPMTARQHKGMVDTFA